MLSQKRLLDYNARQALCKLFKVFCFLIRELVLLNLIMLEMLWNKIRFLLSTGLLAIGC